MKKLIKPRFIIFELILLTTIILGLPVLQSCDETEDIAEIFDKIEYFQFDYKTVPSNSMTTEFAIAQIMAEDPQLMIGMSRFVPKDPELNAGASNEARVFGNPTQAGSSFTMHMRRDARSNEPFYVSEIKIDSPQGPFSEGQILNTATVTVKTGDISTGKTYISNTADTQVRIKITSINTIAKKFGGEFYFVLRDTNNPATSDFLAVAEGTFLFNY